VSLRLALERLTEESSATAGVGEAPARSSPRALSLELPKGNPPTTGGRHRFDASDSLEQRLFVGRADQLAAFRAWLDSSSPHPELLALSGPGGIGKSMLLRAFCREANSSGFRAVLIDGRACRPTPEAFLAAVAAEIGLAAISCSTAETLVCKVTEELARTPTVLLVDTFEVLGNLTGFLRDTFFPALDPCVRVVVAGRYRLGLAWRRAGGLARLVRGVTLDVLAPDEADAYLDRRGLADPYLRAEALQVAGGHPLTLALAADLALQRETNNFSAAPEWSLAVRGLAEQLLEHIDDPVLCDLIEAASVVRQFDTGTLASLVGPAARGAFERLCRLSIVRPTTRGLMLHEYVRRILADDLRWRDPDRYRALRRRALDHYRQRLSTVRGEARESLLAEQFYLREDAFVRGMLFADAEPGEVWLEPARPEDRAELQRIWDFYLETVLKPQMSMRWDKDIDQKYLDDVLDYPNARVRVARDRDDRLIGFNTCLPLCEGSIPLLSAYPHSAAPVAAIIDRVGIEAVTRGSSFFLLHLACTDVLTDLVRATLVRDMVGVLANADFVCTATPIPAYKELLERLGWELLPAGRNRFFSEQFPTDTYILDLREDGLDAWLQRLMDGVAGPPNSRSSPQTARQNSGHLVPSRPDGAGPLTAREREVALLAARGLSNREIARALVVSERTVESHVSHALARLSLASRAQLAVWAVRSGLLDASAS